MLLTLAGCNRNSSTTSQENTTLDSINQVPEWLMVQVDRALPLNGLNVWVPGTDLKTSSLVRVPRFPGRGYEVETAQNGQRVFLESVRNEQISAQIAVASDSDISNLRVNISDLENQDQSVIENENINTRFVQFLPVQNALTGAQLSQINTEGISGARTPDVVGDPLVEIDQVDVPLLRAQPVWITIDVPEDTAPGTYEGIIEVQTDQYDTFTFELDLEVHDEVIPDPEDFLFNLDVWINPFAVSDYHEVDPWSEEHWEKLQPYLEDMTQWGQKKILTTIVEKPWKVSWLHDEYREQTDAEFGSMIKWTLHSDGEWSFDYSIFDRYVEESLKAGNGPTIVAYSMLVFRGDQRVTYYDEEKEELIEESMDLMEDRYEEVWTPFLESFSAHLKEKGWFEQTHLGFDERPSQLMDRVFSIIENAEPEFSDKIYISGGVVDMEVADLNIEIVRFDDEGIHQDIIERSSKGLPTRFYQTCCSGAHPNRFTFSPAVELQMIPWIALKFNFDGYVNWAYNHWPKDIYKNPVFNFTQGDEYFVYPGEDGPVSSIRWELIREGIEDFELAKILETNGTISSDQLNEAIDLATQDAFTGEKDAKEMVKAREILLQAIN